MSQKRFALLSLAVAMLAALMFSSVARPATAQSGTPAATSAGTAAAAQSTPVATLPFVNGKPQELKIYNFTTYIADDTIANFEKLYNVKITYDTFGKADEMYAKLQAGNPGYDVVIAPDYMVTQLSGLDLLLPLDFNHIPNFGKNASVAFKNPAYDPGNKFSVAYQWGTMGIGYNTAKVAKPITGIADLFDPATYGGQKKRTALLNSSRETIALILIYLGLDANTTNKADLDKVRDYLLKNKDSIAAFHNDDGQTILAQGSIDAVMEWSGDMFQVMAEKGNENLAYVVPKEGTFRWTDNMVIPKGAGNKALAELFINYVYDAAVGASIANYTQYGSPNQAAIDMKLIDDALLSNPAVYPANFDKLVVLKDLGDAATIYDQTWAEIVAGVGN